MTRAHQKLNRKKKDARLARRAPTASPSIGETSYARFQSRTEAFALLEPARVHNRALVNGLLREGRISAATATAIKNRFCAPHQSRRLLALQGLEAVGEPLGGETPYQKLTEEEVLAEDAAKRGEVGAASAERGGDEEVEGKGKGKAVLVEEKGAVGPIGYDAESEWEQEGPIPVSGDDEDDEMYDVWAQ
ncbi:hypothetical protein MMC17_003466 [Xylographa soralifera]|nr:hypothetical protein [Xylographa soralifera]